MDVRKFARGFIKVDDVRDGPRQEKIAEVFWHEKFDCPVLVFESGDEFLLNNTNTRILSRAWGWETDRWLGLIVELQLGTYTDFKDNNEEKETVRTHPISVRQPSPDNGGEKAPASAPRRDDLSDEIPF